MGVRQWLREYIDFITIFGASQQSFIPGLDVDLIAHILQRAVEGGHWMLTPPRLLTLVHAVQQPIGAPRWMRSRCSATPATSARSVEPERAPTQTSGTLRRLRAAWRKPNSGGVRICSGGLLVHGASTVKKWISRQLGMIRWMTGVSAKPGISHHRRASTRFHRHVRSAGACVYASGTPQRPVGWYEPQADLIALERAGDALGSLAEGKTIYQDAAPRHHFNDTKHHRVSYTAVATSRYRDYFPPDACARLHPCERTGDRGCAGVRTGPDDVCAWLYVQAPTLAGSGRPRTNMKRSVRFLAAADCAFTSNAHAVLSALDELLYGRFGARQAASPMIPRARSGSHS